MTSLDPPDPLLSIVNLSVVLFKIEFTIQENITTGSQSHPLSSGNSFGDSGEGCGDHALRAK